HRERTAPERLAVQRRDRGLRLVVGRHLDEREAARPTGLPVGDDLHLLDLAAVLLEEGAQLLLLALVGEVANIQSLSHASSRARRRLRSRPRRTYGSLLARADRERPVRGNGAGR